MLWNVTALINAPGNPKKNTNVMEYTIPITVPAILIVTYHLNCLYPLTIEIKSVFSVYRKMVKPKMIKT